MVVLRYHKCCVGHKGGTQRATLDHSFVDFGEGAFAVSCRNGLDHWFIQRDINADN